MNLDEFSYVADDRRYINPQVGLDESNAFIDNLRNTQAQRTEEIAQDTYNLGTAIPSNLGGLGGAGSYFTARYQTPQTNAIIGDLKATAQAQALSEAMGNELSKAKQRYSNAYKAAQRRATTSPSPSGGNDGKNDIETDSSQKELTVGDKEQWNFGYYTDESGKARYGTLDAQYQLLDAGKMANVWSMQNKFPNGKALREGQQYQDSSGTYIYTNGKIYRMWQGVPYK